MKSKSHPRIHLAVLQQCKSQVACQKWLSEFFLFTREGGEMMMLQAAISRLGLLNPEVPLWLQWEGVK